MRMGLFFGGFEASWTNKTLRAVVKKHAGNAKHLALLDFHTGLGPYGHGELIYVGNPAGTASCHHMVWRGCHLS